MSEYNTEQKKLLLGFLKSNKDKSFTVEEIESEMINSGLTPPGISTIYRLVSKLSKAGTVKKFTPENKRKAVYQLQGGSECDEHLHMKCTECGKLLHMSDNASRELLEKILGLSNFSVDKEKTVLFGKCRVCESNSKASINDKKSN